MNARRAMTPDAAREKKLSGHVNERDFAKVIGGHVQRGIHTDKCDVYDDRDNAHTVKAGVWWQIFLYAESRLQNNTVFRGIGNIAPIMVDCLQAFPPTFEAYESDKISCKERLREPMRLLLAELENPRTLAAFFAKAMFDGGTADYLSLFNGPANAKPEEKHFHIFHREDVCRILLDDLTPANSKYRKPGDTAEQKVVFASACCKKQMGEIEVRADKQNYRLMKMRLNGPMVARVLDSDGMSAKLVRPEATAHGIAARRKF